MGRKLYEKMSYYDNNRIFPSAPVAGFDIVLDAVWKVAANWMQMVIYICQ